MSLRAVKPHAIQKRLKCLLYGLAGVGKTTTAISFPRPYLIDTERGSENSQYVELLNKNNGAYWFTTDPDDLIKEVASLLSEKHDYRTLIIDPLTVIYNDLLDKGIDQAGGTDFGRHKIPADRKIKRLINLLLRLDMNVIITSHAKPNWVRAKDASGKETVVQQGSTFDCYGKLDYLFDLVLEAQKRGTERVAVVRKSRIKGLGDQDIIPFTYDEIADRYGREVLEKSADVEELASPEQIDELNRLVELLSIPAATTDKWLDKAKADDWSEMPSIDIAKCIEFLKSKVTGEKQCA